ncbi:MAG: MFS transporter [Promethearchaeia archaeon]
MNTQEKKNSKQSSVKNANEHESKSQHKSDLDLVVKLSILIAILTSIFTGLAYNVYSIIQPAIFDAEPAWELNAAMAGELLSSMVLLFAGVGVIAGYYVDNISKKPVAIIGGWVTGISCVISGVAPTWDVFFFSHVFIALGNGIIAPVIFALISDMTPPEKRGTNYGLILFLSIVGGLVGALLFLGFLTIGEWRIPYILTGIIILTFSFALLPIRLPKRGRKEHALEDILKEEGVEYEYYIEPKDIPRIFKRKSNIILLLNFADALPGGIFLFATLWLSEQHNLNLGLAGIFAVLLLAVRYISAPVWGKVADTIYQKTKDPLARIKIIITLLITYTPLFIIAVLIPWRAPDGASLGDLFLIPEFVLFLVLLFVAISISSGIHPIWQSAITEINLPEHRATSYQLGNFMDQVGIALGAFIGGHLIVSFESGGYTVAFIFAAIMGIIDIALWGLAFFTYEEDKKEVENILYERAEKLEKEVKDR